MAFGALRHRNFRLFFGGHLLSLTGTWMQSTAQGWLVLELTDSALLLGAVGAVQMLPILLFTLAAGVFADAADKRRILIISQTGALIAALGLAMLTDRGDLTVLRVMALVFLLGTASAFEIPTRQAFFAELVGRRDLQGAIALNSSAFSATRIVGPALAGVVIGTAGVAAAFYANAISYLAVIAGLLAIRLPPFARPERTATPLENFREGVRYISGHRLTRTLVWLTAAMSVTAFPYTMLLPIFARDVLGVGATGLGWLLSASGAGALAGGVGLAASGGGRRRGRLMLVSAVLFALLVMGFALSRSFPLSLLLLAGAGCTMILTTATVNSLIQTSVPNELRGRVMAVYVFMFLGVGPLGSLQAGALASWLGAPIAAAVGGLALLLVVITMAWRVRELRETR